MSTALSDGDGQIGQAVAEEDHDGRQGRRRDEPGKLGLAADGIVHGGAGIRAGDRKAAEQARGDVGGAEADQLAIGIDVIVVLEAEAARRHDAAAEADEQDAERRQRKILERRGPWGMGRAKTGRACGMPPTRCMPRPLKIEGAGTAADRARPRPEDREGAAPGGARRATRRAAPSPRAKVGRCAPPSFRPRSARALEEIVAGNGEARQLAELADDQVQRHPGEESHEHGLGEEIGDEAEAEAAGGHAGEADGDGEGRGDHDALVASRTMPRLSRALATIMQVAVSGPIMRRPRGAEEGVADRRQDGGIEPRLRRQADDRRIGDGRGQGHGRDGKTGQEIGAEPGAR